MATTMHPQAVRNPTIRSTAMWMLVSVGVATFFVVTIFLIISGQGASYQPEITGRPAIQVSETQFEYGDVHYNTPITTSFQVKNVGDNTLFILGDPQIQVLEGCCPPRVNTSSRQLEPGQEATVSFTFSMHEGMDGPHHFLVHVRTNDPVIDDQYVHVTSNWIP
jgi:hypothetical protein